MSNIEHEKSNAAGADGAHFVRDLLRATPLYLFIDGARAAIAGRG